MSVDSKTLFKQARLELKAAAAFFESAQSAHRYILELENKQDRVYENMYRRTIDLGVPHYIAATAAKQASYELHREIQEVKEEGLTSVEMARFHRDMGEALLLRCQEVQIEEQRRLMKEN